MTFGLNEPRKTSKNQCLSCQLILIKLLCGLLLDKLVYVTLLVYMHYFVCYIKSRHCCITIEIIRFS